MKRIILLVLIFCLAAGYVFARRGVDPSFIPIDDEPYYSGGTSGPSGREWKDPYLGMEFVWVEGGCYEMGCGSWTDSCDSDEKPVHTVCVDGFWMGKYEVTVGQWKRFVRETGYKSDAEKEGWSWFWNGKWKKKKGINWKNPGFSQGKSHPVIHVSWNDAKAFAKWLSRKTGCTFRLPTEAEWEYACRSGGKKVKYAWGNGDPYINGQKAANIADESAKRKFSDWTIWNGYDDGYVYTSPVGSFAPNSLGLYDMTGNVWEWCEDWYDKNYYSRSPRNNPQGPSSGKYRVLRGGSWCSGPRFIRCALRLRCRPDFRYYDGGFRLVRLRSAQ